MRWIRGFFATGAIAAVSLLGASAAAELPDVSAPTPWTLTEQSDADGGSYRMYQRRVPGSDFAAFRIEATIEAPPVIVALAAQRDVADPAAASGNLTKTILRDDPDGTIVYSYIDLPLVADRDVTTRTVRRSDPRTGSRRVEWRVTDEGPAPKQGVVRLSQSSGSWVFRPLPGDRTHAVYENHTDIGGAIPGWLVDRLMRDTVVTGIISLRARVERDRGRVAADAHSESTAR